MAKVIGISAAVMVLFIIAGVVLAAIGKFLIGLALVVGLFLVAGILLAAIMGGKFVSFFRSF